MPRRRWSHAYVQWLLLDWGRKTGHEVWVAKNDRNRTVGTVRVGDVCLPAIPTTLPERMRLVLEQVDVVWFPLGSASPSHLFEVEHSTNIVTGLLRMNDILLTIGPPVEGWQLSVVAPARRLSRFRTEITRPTFQTTGLSERCRFTSYDELARAHRSALSRR
jgi:type II restriction enzyme